MYRPRSPWWGPFRSSRRATAHTTRPSKANARGLAPPYTEYSSIEDGNMDRMITSVHLVSRTDLVVAVGVPFFVALFYFDGMVIGKFTPPGALFFGYVVAVNPPRLVLVSVVGLCVAASTLGQWTLYRGFNEDSPELIGIRRRVPYLNRLPLFVRTKVGERWMRFVTRAFDRFGGGALCLTNAVPGMAGLMSIPAGLSRYPLGRFLLFATVGNVFYMVLLVAAAKGIIDLF